MNISGPSASNPIWTSHASADRELIYQSTGWRMPDGFDDATTGGDNQKAVMIPKMAAILAMDRQAGRLGAGQEVTAAYIRDAVQQYQRTSLDGSNPYRGQEWDKALAYLASKGGRTDVNA